MDKITQYLHQLILDLLKCEPSVKAETLSWLSNCLKANSDRGKLWTAHTMDMFARTVSDGFMINLLHVLMRFSKPFCSSDNQVKVLKVDPTYCAVSVSAQGLCA